MKSEESLRLALPGGERLAVRFLPARSGSEAPFCFLYLHGFGSVQSGEKAEHFRARAAERGLPFCSFDLRGHGASDGSLRDLTFGHCLEDLAAVRAWLAGRGERRIVLFGSSMGAAAALWHAGEHPEDLVAAVHVAPAVAMRAGLERWAGEAGLERWRREGNIRFRNELVDAELGWELVEDLRRRDFGELAARYRTPTLVFQGRLDATVDWRDVASFAAGCPPGVVDLRIFEDGGHRLTERKDEIWATACAWLEAIASSES